MANPIATENALTGTTAWKITLASTIQIQAYADAVDIVAEHYYKQRHKNSRKHALLFCHDLRYCYQRSKTNIQIIFSSKIPF